MQKITTAISTVLSVCTCLTAASQPTGEITVHVDQPTVVLPKALYGLFYEDINYAADGGLYAELVQNRSFEYFALDGREKMSDKRSLEHHPLFAWEKVECGGGSCDLKVERSVPLNRNNQNYLAVYIHQAGDGVGVRNLGYDGIRVDEGESYDVSLHAARWGGGKEPAVVALEGDDGKVYGTMTTGPLNVDWQQFEGVIKVNQSDDQARLTVTTTGKGKLYLDMVSLFPQNTFKGRKNGLRPDLVQALVDLNPKFLRFPGGCIAHGCSLENAYRWKDTVGDLAQRRPNWNRWGYHQTYGLGYYEYFLLCEDLGAAPLPVVPVGVSCGYNKPYQVVPSDELQEWIDDALDLVEFANGSVESRWGKVRAEMGHPEPFGLEYICLGNEEHDTPEVRERIPYFVKAIRQAYPEIRLIGTSGLGHHTPLYPLMKELNVHSSDEHYYSHPEWYLQNLDRFDRVERSGPKIFVGEYASRGNTMFNAVAEAAYLTGIERNGDVVDMACYAPLLARYGFTQWGAANLIWFDHRTVVRTPNYYVQQLFSRNKGDRHLKNESVFDFALPPEAKPALGRIGVGTWETTAIFDDISVRSGDRTLIDESFSEDARNWQGTSGSFAARDGAYSQSDVRQKAALSLCRTEVNASNVVYTLRAKKTGGREGFRITFGSRPGGHFYRWNIGGWGNSRHVVEKGGGGKAQLVSKNGSIEANVWYDIRIEVTGSRIKCFLNDELIHDLTDAPPTLGIGVAASREDSSGDIIVKIASPLARPCKTRINLRGVDAVKPTATLTLLTGDKGDVNDLENPDRVKPVVRRIPVATSFDYTIPPMSVQVLRIEPNGG